MQKTFVKLSEILTGFNPVDKLLAYKFYEILLQKYQSDFKDLLTEFEKIIGKNEIEKVIKDKLLPIPKFKAIIKNIIFIWYVGCMEDDKINENYYQALLWKAIHAHPPGLTGGYFGYWHYKPEN